MPKNNSADIAKSIKICCKERLPIVICCNKIGICCMIATDSFNNDYLISLFQDIDDIFFRDSLTRIESQHRFIEYIASQHIEVFF